MKVKLETIKKTIEDAINDVISTKTPTWGFGKQYVIDTLNYVLDQIKKSNKQGDTLDDSEENFRPTGKEEAEE
tara:strand:- start:2399 stop:2617 length:219 start_codon:yes stop_codon:yes gene_type:complete